MKFLLLVLAMVCSSFIGFAQYTTTTLHSGGWYTAAAKDNSNNVYVVRYNGSSYEVAKYLNGDPANVTVIYTGLTVASSEYSWGLTVNAAGDVFVTNPEPASHWQIIKLAAGTYTPSVIHSGNYYTALAIDASQNLLSMEYDGAGKYQVVRYAAAAYNGAGTVLYNGIALPSPTDGTYPYGIVADASNNIYFLDFLAHSNGQIIKLTAPAYTASTVASGGAYTSIAIDGSGNIYTSELTGATTGRVMKYAALPGAGTQIYGSLSAQTLFYPWGLAVNSSGHVFVCDGAAAGNGQFLKLAPPTITVNSVTRLDANPSNAATVRYTVTFSATPTNVTTSAFSLNTTGISGPGIASVTGTGPSYTVTVNTGTGDGTLRLDVTGTGISSTITNLPYTTGQVYTIDKTAPTGSLSINSGAAQTNNAAVTLDLTGNDAVGPLQMRFSNDNTTFGAWTAFAATSAWNLSAGDGLKTVYMELKDAAGNVSSFQDQITLDATAPNTNITSGPPTVTNSSNANFSFTSTETGTFEASLDGGAFTAVTTPLSFSGVAPGNHTFQVRAIDQAGNTDATPATYSWAVDQIAPTVASVVVPANGYYKAGNVLNFVVTFSEPVTVTGTPYLPVTIGSTVVQASYIGGTGSSALGFSYTVLAGQSDLDGIAVGSAINLNGGTLQDAATNNAVLTLNNVGPTGSVFVYAITPTVVLSGTPSLNAPWTMTVTFSEAVTGFATGDFTISNAVLSGLTTTDNITYTVNVTPIAPGSVSIQVPANAAQNVGNNGNTASNTITYTFDNVAPTVTSVAVPANGYYKTGDVLNFTVNFSEAVTVTGTPRISMVIGTNTVYATYVSGSGTNALSFAYTVLAGQSDLNGITVGSLGLNGGTIQDAATNNANLTLNSVGSTANVFVYAITPTVTLSGTPDAGAPWTMTITFSEAVSGFTATDFITTNATISNLQTSNSITFTALVTASGGGAVTIQVPAGAAQNIGGNDNSASNIINYTHDIIPPAITSVSVPANGYYKTGNVLSFTVNFDENVTVTGTPSLPITIGSTTVQATYASGTGSAALVFSYTVQNGQSDLDGITAGSSLQLNGGTIRDAAANNAVLTLNSVGSTSGVFVHAVELTVQLSTGGVSLTAPWTLTIIFSEAVTGFDASDVNATNATISNLQTTDNTTFTVLVSPVAEGNVSLQIPANAAINVAATGNNASTPITYYYDPNPPVITSVNVPANGYYKAGDVLNFTVNFNENVIVTGTPSLPVTIGSTTVQATYAGGTGTSALTFSYTVQDGEKDLDGITVATSLQLNGATLRDLSGNNAVLALNNIANTGNVFVYAIVPTVQLSGTPALNAPWTVTITFSEAMTGFSISDLTTTNAATSNLQTSDNITYTALITPTADGPVSIQVPANAAFNIGNNGNTASNTINYTYDGTPPVITSVDVPANGYYNAGMNLDFTVHFSENVTVNTSGGSPTLPVTIGQSTVQATYISGSGTNALQFRYTVQNGEMDMDGIALGAALALNGSTLQDAATNNAVRTLNNSGSTAGVFVNTAHPLVTVSTGAPGRTNAPFTVTITFGEAVTGLALSDIAVTNGSVSNLQTTDNISYTVLVTPTADGAVTVQIPANAAVNIGNNGNTASNTVTVTYDATAPLITAAQNFTILMNSAAGTFVGKILATESTGILQNWTIATDGSGGALQLDQIGTLTVKDMAILNSKAGTTVILQVTVSDGLNTSAATPVSVQILFINKAPTLDAIQNITTCANTQSHTIQLTGASATEPNQTYGFTVSASQNWFDALSVSPSGLLTYQLKPSATSGAVTVAVTIKDNGGTANDGVDTLRRTFTITVNPLPQITITSDKGNHVSKGETIHLTATGGSTYNWTGNGGIVSGQQTAVLEARPALPVTTYTVTATSAAGCTNTASIDITTIEDFKVDATNILTPNADGKNDRWVIRNIDSYPDNYVRVYDRAGRMVFQRRNYANDWDGTLDGRPLAEGTYYYILTIGGGKKVAKGFITIIRDRY